jgi:toxin ParE1/3/4
MSRSEACVWLTAQAKHDIVDILAWSSLEWEPAMAEIFGLMILDALDSVGANPHFGLFPELGDQGIGYSGAGRHIIVYRFDDTSVAILRVLLHKEMLADVVVEMS